MQVRWEGGGETSKKIGKSSSGCETHPTKDKPGRSEVSLAAFRVTGRLMRRYTSVRAAKMQPRKGQFPGVEGFIALEDNSAASRKEGEGRAHPAGCWAGARTKRTALVNWEIPFIPREERGRNGEPDHNLQRARGSE